MTHEFGTGALKDTIDWRDYQFLPQSSLYDWEKGFDIEKKIGNKLVTKDQNGSYSCGGQAWAYYMEVLETLATGTYEPRSARWIYSHTGVPSGGSAGRVNCDFVIKNGCALEFDAVSYDNGKPPKEAFMMTKPRLSQQAREIAEVSKALSYLNVKVDIDTFAHAIEANNGLILSIYGQDNGTWRTKFPKPPTSKVWLHWVYAGKTRLHYGKKQIGFINSWGNIGDNGWQWVDAEYFENGNILDGWTLAWDYKPAKIKVVLNQMITLYQQLIQKLTTAKK